MAEYIERDAAIETAVDYRIDVIENEYDRGYQIAVQDIAKGLNAIPAADVAPVVHGRWIQLERIRDRFVDEGHDFKYECSECSYEDIHSENIEVPYCWHCGAKMDLEGL